MEFWRSGGGGRKVIMRVVEGGSGRPETLTSSAAAHEAEVVEAGHLVLHHARGVAQLGRVVLVVARHHRHHRPVGYVSQGDHLSEAARKVKRFNRPPGY